MLLVIKGKTDDWRVQRKCAWAVASAWVKDMPPEKDFLPLMFDDEIADAPGIDPTELYNQASQEMANFDWSTIASKN